MKVLQHFIPILFLLCSCGQLKETAEEDIYKKIEIPIQHEYSEISDYSISRDMMFDIDHEQYYVYFYSLTCTHCNNIKDFMIERAIDRKDIFFVKSSSGDKLTNDEKLLIGAEIPEDFYILGYPSLVLIKNKKCIKNIAGISTIKDELK